MAADEPVQDADTADPTVESMQLTSQEEGDGEQTQADNENGDENGKEEVEGGDGEDGNESQNAFGNNGFAGGDMNQMQMMMAMQNGMGGSFPNFPMMGKHTSMPAVAPHKLTNRRYAWNEHGSNGDAKHVYEWRLSKHGHEWHGRTWRISRK